MKGVKEIAADEEWPTELDTKKHLPIVSRGGVITKNRFQLGLEQIVNTVTKVPTKISEKCIVQIKTEKSKKNNKMKKSQKKK